MSFIAKNPLVLPEIDGVPDVPNGMRGLVAGKDGWYDISSKGKKTKLSKYIQSVTIKGGATNWTQEEVLNSAGTVVGHRYGQVVTVENANITKFSKVDLQLNSEQIVIFSNKALAFVTENDDGIVTVYCVGAIPEEDYTMQVTITEVVVHD